MQMRPVFPALLSVVAALAAAQTAVKDPRALNIRFEHYTCKDRFGRKIDFYLSLTKRTERLPLAVAVQGSGGQSIWVPHGGHIYGGLQILLEKAAKGRARILAVENPGVPFCYQGCTPGTAEGATKEFMREHVLDRWVEAVDSAVRACRKLPHVDGSRTLAVGHSEGGIVVARLAAVDPTITDVAVLAGGGPSQIFDFFHLFGREKTLETLSEIHKDPMSATKLVWGHPYRRWTTFFATSPLEEALKSRARFFIGQGTADNNCFPEGANVLYATLLGHRRDVQMEVVEGADHGFQVPGGEPPPAGFSKMLGHVFEWFFGPK